ncbi:MAG: type II toxin-antitoxin system RelE/ParE family toxin [Dongiaceae bacterium]
MRIVWSPTARDDLRHLHAYIAQRNPGAARSIARTILDGVGNLRRFPAIGRPGRVAGTRELVITGTPFVVPYHVIGQAIEIVAVLHGARRWPDDDG